MAGDAHELDLYFSSSCFVHLFGIILLKIKTCQVLIPTLTPAHKFKIAGTIRESLFKTQCIDSNKTIILLDSDNCLSWPAGVGSGSMVKPGLTRLCRCNIDKKDVTRRYNYRFFCLKCKIKKPCCCRNTGWITSSPSHPGWLDISKFRVLLHYTVSHVLYSHYKC